MSKPLPKTIIIGGGVCGLYAGHTLSRNHFPVTIVEKQAVVGGLAACLEHEGNCYDLGVHMMHEHDREIFEDCAEMMGERRVEARLSARIRWAGSYYRYPLQFADMVTGMPPSRLFSCMTGLFWQQLRNKIAPWNPKDCEEALIQLYGRPLYEFFFREFTSRYWGMPPTQMSAEFVRRKMPRLTAVDAVKKLLKYIGVKDHAGATTHSALLEETLHYSRQGAQTLPNSISERIVNEGGKVLVNHAVEQIQLSTQGSISRVESITILNQTSNSSESLACEHLISTMPVTRLIDALGPKVPQAVRESASRLRYLPIVAYGLLVKKEQVFADALYAYYRERIFHRVGEPKNAGLQVQPAGHTVLIVEMTCQLDSPEWRGEPAVLDQIFADLHAEGLCRAEDVVSHCLHRNAYGYPIFELGFETHFRCVFDFLQSIENLQSVGRQGGFNFPGMHTAMRMGAKAAQQIIDSNSKN